MTLFVSPDRRTDVVPGDEDDAGGGPQLDEHHPERAPEGTLVVVVDPDPQLAAALLPGLEDQGGGDDVLDAGPGVAAGDPHQELQAVRGQRYGRGRHQG